MASRFGKRPRWRLAAWGVSAIVGAAFLCPVPAAAQSDLAVKETADYRFSVPSGWQEVNLRSHGTDFFFEASGVSFPAQYNGGPLGLSSAVMGYQAADLEEAKAFLIKGYSASPDREFEPGFTHDEERTSLKSGQPAYILSTRYYRKSKDNYHSRQDLIAYSDCTHKAYFFSIAIKHNDKTYHILEQLDFAGFAKSLYRTFELKQCGA